MSTGQIFLTLGAVILLLYTSINLNRSYLVSAGEGVRVQYDMDAIGYAQNLSEMVHAQATNYTGFSSQFGNLADINNPDERLEFQTQTGEVLYATLTISDEQPLVQSHPGRIVTITVFQQTDGVMEQRAEFFTAITQM